MNFDKIIYHRKLASKTKDKYTKAENQKHSNL